MSFRGPYITARSDPHDQFDDAYVRSEEARLRCEDLAAQAATGHEWVLLRQIHRELGMAGWLTGAEIDSDRRLELLASARDRSRQPMLNALNQTHALAATAILAEDAVVHGLADEDLSDQLHLAHLHLLAAEELLHAHL